MGLPVVELFSALQGEGNKMGMPSIFIRTGLCTLTCAGFKCELKSPKTGEMIQGCDSIHAVNKDFKDEWQNYEFAELLIDDILHEIVTGDERFGMKPDIIFTGGEPTLHHANPVMLKTLEYFVSRGYSVYFETNGTVDIDFDKYDIFRKVKFSISVKMSNSGEPTERRWKPEIVNKYIKYTNGSYFKFVFLNNPDEMIQFLRLVPSFAPVYIMPQGATREQLNENAIHAYEFAYKNGFLYSDRLHIRIYDDLREV